VLLFTDDKTTLFIPGAKASFTAELCPFIIRNQCLCINNVVNAFLCRYKVTKCFVYDNFCTELSVGINEPRFILAS
jgi:hypothetical protein